MYDGDSRTAVGSGDQDDPSGQVDLWHFRHGHEELAVDGSSEVAECHDERAGRASSGGGMGRRKR